MCPALLSNSHLIFVMLLGDNYLSLHVCFTDDKKIQYLNYIRKVELVVTRAAKIKTIVL